MDPRTMSVKRERSTSPPPKAAPSQIYISNTIHEQTSTFIAAFSPTLSTKALQALPQFQTATHRIVAWRKPSRQKSLTPASRTLFDMGHDDDGEKWAGGRLSNVLRDTETSGSVVVARWYGGQNIGPIRFTHIEACAKDAIRKYADAVAQAQKEQASKKQKVDEEARRQDLIRNLQERDYNIFALRKLLCEKKAKAQGECAQPPTPQKLQDYGAMSMEALSRVDKARDATIAFILKQIDKVDEELKLVEALDGGAGEAALNKVEKEDKSPSTVE